MIRGVDREDLVHWLDDGLSLDQIGGIVGRRPSTVAYWLRKYGLTANGHDRHSPKGGLTRQQLEPLLQEGLTLAVIADELGVSITSVRYWIQRHDLPRRRSTRRSEIDRALEEGRRTLLRECKRHGWTVFVIENSGRARCRRCRMDQVAAWRRRAKARLVEEAGGRCVACGYDDHLAALQFHHLDPSTKKFGLSMRGVTRSMEKLREEAAKCVLLCANCHAEVEAGYLEL
jgi:transposase